MQFSAEITLNDHRDCLAFFLSEEASSAQKDDWFERPRLFFFYGILALGFLIYQFYSGSQIGWEIVLLVLGFFLIAWRQKSNAMPREFDEIEESIVLDGFNVGLARFNLEQEGLRVDFGLVRHSYVWRSIQVLKEAPEAFYLMVRGGDLMFPGDHIIVPKRAFADQEKRERFRKLCQSNIEPNQ